MISLQEITKVKEQAYLSLAEANDLDQIEQLRIEFIGRKQGKLTLFFSQLPGLKVEDKRKFAPLLTEIRNDFTKKLEKRLVEIDRQTKNISKIKNSSDRPAEAKIFDPTLPGLKPQVGHEHPTIKVISEIKEIFHYLGFGWKDGPEVEFDLYNFQKLRLHKNHPARDTQQTYYLNDDVLLRTQTSSMQIRYMEAHKPPIRMLFPGRVYRREAIDATHLPSFYQVEGLLVDQKTSMTDLIGVLDFFAKKTFGGQTKIRIYGHHFPYTEPSIEVEVLSKSGKWLEILGAGMVHPEVLKNCGIDPKIYRGWAFGMGPERIAMLKYGIDDIRLFYSNSLDFLEQF